MAEKSSSLALIMMRFPEHRECLKRLHSENDSFQSLSDDYRDCLTMVEQESRSTAKQPSSHREELLELLAELEEEILVYIRATTSCTGSGV